MRILLRQIALAARELDSVAETLCSVLGLEVAHNDPGVGIFGLRNALLPLGPGGFLEVVTPIQPDTTVGRLLDKQAANVCGYMVIYQTDDLEEARRRAVVAGQHVVWEIDLGEAATFHLHPKQLGAVVSFDRMKTWDDWLWAGPDWRAHPGKGEVTGLAGATLAVADPAAAAARWQALLGEGAGDIAVGPADASPGGLTSFALRTAVPPAVIQARARAAGLAVTARGFRLGAVEVELRSA